uniref:Methyltransferase n=1 Tax=Leersia perrieri TaxID=77586 RepID=A0A0D9XXF9_9ORYZ
MPLFDRDRYQRLDGTTGGGAGGRRSPSYCSTATIVLFVALCLVGAWMMASTGNVPMTVSPENKSSSSSSAAAKEDDQASIDVTNGGDTPQATDDVADAGRSDDVTNTTGGGTEAAESGKAATAGGDTAAPKNETFSDENGKTEGDEVARPEDPDKQTAEEAPSTDTKENADDVSGETKAIGDGDGGSGGASSKNQTASDDENGKMDGMSPVTDDGSKVTDNNSEQIPTNGADGGEAQSTDDDDTTTTAAAASNNQTISDDHNDASNTTTTTFATEDDIINGTTSAAAAETELLPSGAQADLLNETTPSENASFPTQASESTTENNNLKTTWKLCNVTTGADYIPCLDNESAIKKLKTNKHYEHRERHCPTTPPTCLVPLPAGYRRPIPWPYSRDKIWYANVPHTRLASYKGHQNWVKVSAGGDHLTFPGGGTQFKNGALHYIDLIGAAAPETVRWGRRTRVVLDVGCGVASFGGFLFERGALTMSLAPKDEHEAQVQFALERGIPAISAVMGTKRLPFPGGAFDAVHCARCRVPWHIDGGRLLLEVNRLLRPGGLFVWSATPVYGKLPEDVEIWHDMVALTKSMCWEMVKKTSDTVDQTAVVIFRKPTSNACYGDRKTPEPPLCDGSDDPDAAWNITLRSCMHAVPDGDTSARGARWPEQWPKRLSTAPYWLSTGQVGVYGKPAPDDFTADNEHWSNVVNGSYLTGIGIDWSNVRNVMDMRAVYGGFAAALKDMKVWVMNVVPVDSPDTLPIIYERGLFGMYHDWCESFSTYPRSYDLLHADHLFSKLKNRCKLLPVMVEVDRILRPEGKLIVRDDHDTAKEIESIAKSLHWEVRMTVSKQGEGLLCVEKTMWRPTEVETTTTAS